MRAVNRHVRLAVPLKLVLAGEYGVLENEGLGIVAGIDRRVELEGRSRPGAGIEVRPRGAGMQPLVLPAPDPGGQLESRRTEIARTGAHRFVLEALEAAYAYVGQLGLSAVGIELEIDSSAGTLTLPGEGQPRKLGLGTSAAVTVGTVAAVLSLHGVPIDRQSFRLALGRLALLAHHRAQGGVGSGIDVAAGVHGGLLSYSRADREWLERLERRPQATLMLARSPWPGLRAEALPVPRELRLLCGFTGSSSGTTGFVRGYRRWAARWPEAHQGFVRKSRRSAARLATALRSGVHRNILAALRAAHEPLDELMRWSGLPIVTRELRELIRIAEACGGAAKVSGAGGGDCGVAFAFSRKVAERIEAGWREAGIEPIPLAIDRAGLQEELLSRERPA